MDWSKMDSDRKETILNQEVWDVVEPELLRLLINAFYVIDK